MWELLNSLARNKVQEDLDVPKLVIDGQPIAEGNQVCEIFDTFFSTVGRNLADKIPIIYHSSTYNIFMYDSDYAHSTILPQFEPCNEEEVSKIIDSLDSNSSTGIDGISTKAVKCIKETIIKPLTDCVNKCLSEGYFPDSLKIGKVSPIHKAGTKTDPGNYRPISVLPVMSKVFERIIYSRLLITLPKNTFFLNTNMVFDQNLVHYRQRLI
jgi:hypothetical protein